MSMAVAGLASAGGVAIDDAAPIATSFPAPLTRAPPELPGWLTAVW